MSDENRRRKPSSVRRIILPECTESYSKSNVRMEKPTGSKDPAQKRGKFLFSAYSKAQHTGALYGIAFCKSVRGYEKYFCSVGGNEASVFECLENGSLALLHVFADSDKNEELYTVDWGVDILTHSPMFAMAGLSGRISIVNCVSRSIHMSLSGHGNAVNELRFDVKYPCILFSASKDESIRMWNIQTGVCIAVFGGQHGHHDQIIGIDIHMSGSYFVSSGMDNDIKLWRLDEENVVDAVKKSYVTDRPKNRPFDTQFIDNPCFSRRIHDDYVDSVRFVGDYILSKSTNNQALLWKPERSNAVTKIRKFENPNTDIWFLKFSLDHQFRTFALGSSVGKVYVYEVGVEGKRQSNCELHHPECKSTVRQTSFSRDGNTLIYGCDDGTVWRWDKKCI